MTDINPSFNAPRHITWQHIVNNTYSWLNAWVLFDRSQQVEFNRQQKRHAVLNDLEQATEQLYEHSLEAKVQHDERRAKAEADCAQLLLEWQLAQKQRQEQAKVTGIATSATNDSNYPLWHRQPQHKTPGTDVPLPYDTPKAQSGVRFGGCVWSPGVEGCIACTGSANTTRVWWEHRYHTIHPRTCFGRIWRLWHWRPHQWHGFTSYQAWWQTIRWPATGLTHGGGIVTGTGLWPRIQLWHAFVPGLTCYTRSWMWRRAEATSRLSIQPNCLCRRYETYAEGGREETAGRGGIAISSWTGGWPWLDVNNTHAACCDTVELPTNQQMKDADLSTYAEVHVHYSRISDIYLYS